MAPMHPFPVPDDPAVPEGYAPSDLAALPPDRLRALRSAAQSEEARLSFVRRLVQGRMDIAEAELARRLADGHPARVAELVASLPETLADHFGGVARFAHLDLLDDPAVIDQLTAEVNAIADPALLGNLSALSEDEVRDVLERLHEHEQLLSGRRQAVFLRVDALSGELTRRYRFGELAPESLLAT